MKYFVWSFFIFGMFSSLLAQPVMTLEQCEQLFQKNNLYLLAEQYNIDASKAKEIQAKIWDLPYLNGEFNMINPQDKKVFDVGGSGQKAIAIQQLIYLGGKKKKEVDFAKSNTKLAELQYEQLVRTLRFEIHRNFFEMFFNQVKVNSIVDHLNNLDSLINAYSAQAQKGNVPLKDVVRLQSLSLSFKDQLMEIQKNILFEKENIKVLTKFESDFVLAIDEATIKRKINEPIKLGLLQLQEKALEKNPEYLSSIKIIENNELFLKWQKSMGVPDFTVGASYDQKGGAFNNQVNLTFGIPLAFWNRNKGNIKVAEAQFNQSKILKEQKMVEVKAKIETAYKLFIYQRDQYNQTNASFGNFEIVYSGILQNFQKRNISLIEFTDFMESYNQSILFVNEMKKQYMISGESLNYLTNEKVF